MEKMKDKYETAIEHLNTCPSEEIEEAWNNPSTHIAGCLFKQIKPQDSIHLAGCLTQIRCGMLNAYSVHGIDKILSEAIASDERIPKDPIEIELEHLPVFVEWQRAIEKYYQTGILETSKP